MSRRDDLHRWLFARKGGKAMTYTSRSMPFAVFKPNAVWGGVCELGEVKCRLRIRHNMRAEKGKRLEVWFPHIELGEVVPFEKSTLVGFMKIKGNWRNGTGQCFFEPYKENRENE